MAPYDQRDRHDVVDSAAAPDGPVAGYSPAGPPRPYSAPSTYSTTQRLAAPVGRSPRLNSLASVAVLCLLIGGAAGAGTGALVAHQFDNGASGGATILAPNYQSEKVVSSDVSSLAAGVVKSVGPAVVSVLNSQQPQMGLLGTTQSSSAGSGVIIDGSGYILTNYHVIAQAQYLKVTFANGTSSDASVVGSDSSNDIAVIKVTGKMPAVAHFGDSGKLLAGETVIAIGNALGDLQNTVTEGIVSGLGRSLPNGNDPSGQAMLQNLIQTDAAINHGNSGGPLVDLGGNVIGINTAVVRGTGNSGSGTLQTGDQAEGLGFAIPSNTAKAVVDRLIFRTPAPFLGVEYSPISPQVSSASRLPVGARILTVSKGSPAERSGLRANDVVTAINSQAIDDQHDFKYMLDTYRVGDKVRLSVFRAGKTLTFTVALGRRPAA
jgi:S1-C subfamily serine protease